MKNSSANACELISHARSTSAEVGVVQATRVLQDGACRRTSPKGDWGGPTRTPTGFSCR
jgi:hypothetical protein